jgi:hypothetical protein
MFYGAFGIAARTDTVPDLEDQLDGFIATMLAGARSQARAAARAPR